MLAMAVRNTRKLIRERSAADNVRLGRFFSKRETAAKMASMFTFLETKPLMEILDPGAGTGRRRRSHSDWLALHSCASGSGSRK